VSDIGGHGNGTTALVALGGLVEGSGLVDAVSARFGRPDSVEFVESVGVELVADALGTHPPLAGTAMILLEWRPAARSGRDELIDFLGATPPARGVAIAHDEATRAELWSWRQHVEVARLPVRRVARVVAEVAPADVAALVALAHRALAEVDPDALLIAFGDLTRATVFLDVLDGPCGARSRDGAALLNLLDGAATRFGARLHGGEFTP